MKRAFLVMLVVGALAGLGLMGVAYDADTFVNATISGYVTLDPAEAYDTASGAILSHVYSRLVEYAVESTDIVPGLSTVVPTVANGNLVVHEDGTATYRFPIRTGVKFQDGADLTPSDVVYSLMRHMLVDPIGGPQWMPWFALFGAGGAGDYDDPATFLAEHIFIDPADANVVVIEATVFAPYTLQIMAGAWCSIVDEGYVQSIGGWDGDLATWANWYQLPQEELALYDESNGTGAWTLVGKDPELGFSLDRFDGYFGDLPILKRVEVIYDNEWTNRRLMLENGDADVAFIPVQYLNQVTGTPGFRTVYNLPSLANGALMVNMDIVTQGNDRLGSGALDGAGITADFFTDIHIRRAFAYLFDYDRYVAEVLMGEAIAPPSSIPTALPYSWQERTYFTDLEKALEELKLAWDGEVWAKGFFFRLDYNEGNDNRKVACEMFRDAMMDIDPRFNIEVRGIPWPQYLEDNAAHRLTMFYIGWLPDYPDASNYAHPYYHSGGYFGSRGSFSVLDISDNLDALIDEAALEADEAKRADLYDEVQQIALDNALNVMSNEGTARFWMRRYVANFVYNVCLSGGWNYSVVYKTADGSDGELHPAMADIRHEVAQW
ncbi:ABC transporter substrate-binding protein [Candidatus Bipolaricaulota bacterium]